MYKYKKAVSVLLAVVIVVGCFGLSASAVSECNRGGREVLNVTEQHNDGIGLPADILSSHEAETYEEQIYSEDENVRVSIVLDKDSVLEQGFSTYRLAQNSAAVNARHNILNDQEDIIEAIEDQILDGEKLDVVWRFSLAEDMISANIPYGLVDDIAEMDGVSSVIVEHTYELCVMDDDYNSEEYSTNMATSPAITGSTTAIDEGYTGAGGRIAIIDTGIDTDHQSFDEDAFEYALSLNADALELSYSDYIDSLNLLDANEISDVYDELNLKGKLGQYTSGLSFSSKIAFGANYADRSLDITHDNDTKGDHGSHVAGIAAANRYIPDGNGYISALDNVGVQGVAPDAQLLVFKLFGASGSPHESDYMAAIEDAIMLGADSINMSFGTQNAGYSSSSSAEYDAIFRRVIDAGTIIVSSAGNNYSWSGNTTPEYLYSDGVSFDTVGSPASYTSVMSVASVNNIGRRYNYFYVDGCDTAFPYTEGGDADNQPLTSLAGEHDYIFLTTNGTSKEFEKLGDVVEGKIVFCMRGNNNFTSKANNAMSHGAIGLIVYNTDDTLISMGLNGYAYTAPAVSIIKSDADAILSVSESHTLENNMTYYTGTIDIGDKPGNFVTGTVGNYSISDFSSWGIPGSLILKPEITAPGGLIYSVDGNTQGGTSYKTLNGTSMAAPQISGMTAVVAQYIREKGLCSGSDSDMRAAAKSLLMSTADPVYDSENGSWYPVLQQGAGLANIGKAVMSGSYVMMCSDATDSYFEGKIAAELGDDPDRVGEYEFSFILNNISESTKVFSFDADFFTQDILTVDGVEYLGYNTCILNDSTVFSVSGAQYENGSVSVPAGNSITVTVNTELTDIDDYDINGSYIEGYVFINEVLNENETALRHSIPVIGYYGGWTEPSMYDVGTFIQNNFNFETRTPYLAAAYAAGREENSKYANALIVSYPDMESKYYFGGNMLIDEYDYKPERNALNSENGTKLEGVSLALIRNAVGYKYTVCNEDGKAITSRSGNSALEAAYYNHNSNNWVNAHYNLSSLAGYFEKYNDGSSVEEGTVVRVEFAAAPEYYRNSDNSIDWNSVEDGAKLSVEFVVDNTKPILGTVSVEDGVLTVEASDNQYISGVVVYDNKGNKLGETGSKSDAVPGEEYEYSVSIGDNRLLDIYVYDYALNCSEYKTYSTVNKIYGGTEDSQDILNGDGTGEISFRKKLGYMFAGWYQDSACQIPADFTSVSVDMTVYAKYISAMETTLNMREDDGRIAVMLVLPANDFDECGVEFSLDGVVSCYELYSNGEISVQLMGIIQRVLGKKPSLSCASSRILLSDYESSIKVRVYWITADGTAVYGGWRNTDVLQ